jgi:UMF1 family MFS transporter
MLGPLYKLLGLTRPELRAWASYDWANSAFYTTVVTALFPVWFVRVASAGVPVAVGQRRLLLGTGIAMAISALLAPLLGALADYSAIKKRLLLTCTAIGVVATAAIAFVGGGQWQLSLLCFSIANIGITGSLVFYDALLPHVARPEELDRVSSAGFSLGYLGGGLLLGLNFLCIQYADRLGLPGGDFPVRLSMFSAALWWGLFSIPLWRGVSEPPRKLETDEPARGPRLWLALQRLRETARAIRRFPHAFLMLLAFLAYSDGIGTIIRFAGAFAEERGIPDSTLFGALLAVQFIGVPCALLFAWLARHIGAKRSILIAVGAYAVTCVLAHRLETAADFWRLALLVGLVQGGCQALSRSLFASLIPKHKSAEFFSFFSVSEKLAGLAGPLLFERAIAWTGSSQSAVLSLLVFFVVGAVLLARVDVAAGQRAAQAEEALLRAAEESNP